jgi:hypothetical protein
MGIGSTFSFKVYIDIDKENKKSSNEIFHKKESK